jgi:hypothetical protein
MPTKERYQTRLAPDTADSVDSYADRHDVTSAEAVRRLIRAGLDVEQDDTLDPEEIRADLRELRQAVDDDQDDGSRFKLELGQRLSLYTVASSLLGGLLGASVGALVFL